MVGLHDFEEISNCHYLDWYCICSVICDVRGMDHFYIIILIFIEKHLEMTMVWFLRGCVPNKNVFLSLKIMTCRPGQLRHTTIFVLKWYFDEHILPLTNTVPPCHFKSVGGYTANSIKLQITVQPCLPDGVTRVMTGLVSSRPPNSDKKRAFQNGSVEFMVRSICSRKSEFPSSQSETPSGKPPEVEKSNPETQWNFGKLVIEIQHGGSAH